MAVSGHPIIPGSTNTPIGRLRLHLIYMTFINPNADTAVDTRIASVLNVSLLPYTSEAAAARTLIPPGWRWSTRADGGIDCVRSCDRFSAGYGVQRDRAT